MAFVIERVVCLFDLTYDKGLNGFWNQVLEDRSKKISFSFYQCLTRENWSIESKHNKQFIRKGVKRASGSLESKISTQRMEKIQRKQEKGCLQNWKVQLYRKQWMVYEYLHFLQISPKSQSIVYLQRIHSSVIKCQSPTH